MVDVRSGIAAPSLDDEVDELLQRQPLLRAVVRPERREAASASLEQ